MKLFFTIQIVMSTPETLLINSLPEKTFPSSSHRHRLSSCFTLYPMSQLESLWVLIRDSGSRDFLSAKQRDNDLDKPGISLRFVVDRRHQVWFAPEGQPSPRIPAHGQMSTGRCYGAGNVILNQSGKIDYIDHKSGDFRPDYSSLRWILFLLAAHGQNLMAERITIRKLNASGGVLQNTSYAKNEVIAWSQSLEQTDMTQPEETRVVEVSPQRRNRRRQPRMSSPALFSLDGLVPTEPVERKESGESRGRKCLFFGEDPSPTASYRGDRTRISPVFFPLSDLSPRRPALRQLSLNELEPERQRGRKRLFFGERQSNALLSPAKKARGKSDSNASMKDLFPPLATGYGG